MTRSEKLSLHNDKHMLEVTNANDVRNFLIKATIKSGIEL